jgi:hypothetical protein
MLAAAPDTAIHRGTPDRDDPAPARHAEPDDEIAIVRRAQHDPEAFAPLYAITFGLPVAGPASDPLAAFGASLAQAGQPVPTDDAAPGHRLSSSAKRQIWSALMAERGVRPGSRTRPTTLGAAGSALALNPVTGEIKETHSFAEIAGEIAIDGSRVYVPTRESPDDAMDIVHITVGTSEDWFIMVNVTTAQSATLTLTGPRGAGGPLVILDSNGTLSRSAPRG